MADLWSVLGYDELAVEILRSIRANSDVCLIEGPPGVGKSWFAKGVGGLWEDAGGVTVVAEGDPFRSDVSLYPFAVAMNRLTPGWRTLIPVARNVTKAGEVLLGTGGLITETATAFDGVRRRRKRGQTILLEDREQGVIHDLARLARKKRLLLIADNIHWWDEASFSFLARLRDERMIESFPFLADMRVVAVQTTEPYQAISHRKAHDACLRASSTRRFPVSKVPAHRFSDVLACLGQIPQPDRRVAEVVYSLSGGHLALAGRCAERLSAGESDAFLAAADTDEFIGRILTERLESLGDTGREAVQLLQVAAVLGLAFSGDEIVCASDLDDADTRRILRTCRDERLLDMSRESYSFVHDLYRRHFLELAVTDRIGIHERLADCLRQIRPGEFELRAVNAINAERTGIAGALAVQAGLAREREGTPWTDLPSSVRGAISDSQLDPVMIGLAKARLHVSRYEFAECFAALDSLPSDLTKNLLAEAAYLRAMCLLSTRSEDDRATGRKILKRWAGLESEEPELGVRMALLRLFGLARLADKEEAQTLEHHIQRFLADRTAYDPSAKDALYMLDRCCAGLYQSDVALGRVEKAVNYHRPVEFQSVARRPVEFYRCLNNYCAKLTSNGKYDEALRAYQEALALIDAYAPGTFPRVDFPAMNGLLAKVRLGKVTVAQALRQQQRIVDDLDATSDSFYARNALAVYLAFDDSFDEALDLFDAMDRELWETRGNPDPSMVYLIRANRCSTRFVAGDRSGLGGEWEALSPVVEAITYTMGLYLVRRHALLAPILGGAAEMSAQEFDTCVIERHPEEFGPLWDNFGRGFRMPEVEFWREN